jgi:hypothetical protein
LETTTKKHPQGRRQTACFNKLAARKVPATSPSTSRFKCWSRCFEDIGLLENTLSRGSECKSPTDSYDLLGGLFEAMNTRERAKGGRYKGVDYFNGGLFQTPARIELYEDELNQLREAAKFDWSKVRPEIFGTLFEHSLGAGERHAYGGHFTHPTDIAENRWPDHAEPGGTHR